MTMQEPYLISWGLLSLLFWIPALARKTVLSLWHSLVFFFFLARDLFLHSFYRVDKSVVQNDMKIYTNSLLINIAAFAFIFLIAYLFISRKRP